MCFSWFQNHLSNLLAMTELLSLVRGVLTHVYRAEMCPPELPALRVRVPPPAMPRSIEKGSEDSGWPWEQRYAALPGGIAMSMTK